MIEYEQLWVRYVYLNANERCFLVQLGLPKLSVN